MNIIVDRLPDCKADVRVEVPEAVVEKQRNSLVSAYAQQAKLPGFRPGKAPRKVVEQRYKKAIEEELEERLTSMGLSEAMKREDLRVLRLGSRREVQFHVDGTFSFVQALMLAPEFTLPKYKEIPVRKPKVEVADEDIDKMVDYLRERMGMPREVSDRGAEKGEFVHIDYTSTLDGQPLEEALEGVNAAFAKGEDMPVMVPKTDDEGPGFLGFGGELEGAKVGDEKVISVRYKDDFREEILRGQDVVFSLKVGKISRIELPEVTDEFAKGAVGVDSVEEMRSRIEQDIRSRREREADGEVTNQIIAFLDQSVDADIPSELVTAQTQNEVNDIVNRVSGMGMSEDQIQERQEDIINTASARARVTLKTDFILQEIAREENIEVDNNDVANRVAMYAMQQQTSPGKLLKQLEKEGRIDGVKTQILISKTLEFLSAHASVEEVDPEELKASEGEEREA